MQLKKFWSMTPLIISLLLLIMVPCSTRGAAVLSGMEIISGQRGTILSLRSDNPIECSVSISAKTLVKISIPGCVYGLQDFSYTKFEKESPVFSIFAKEKKDGSGIELTITMKSIVDKLPIVKTKDTDAHILLSKNEGNTFNWKAVSVSKPETMVTKKEVREQSVIRTKAVTSDSAENKAGKKSACRLIDIEMVYREQVCRINFKFNGMVQRKVHRNRDSLICVFTGAENGLEKTSFNLLPPTVYRKILLTENNNQKALIARIVIDTAAYQSMVNIVFEDSLIFTVMTLNKDASYNAFWRAHSGIVWEHELTFVKPFEIDLKKLGERAEKDVSVNLTSGPVFRIGDFYSGSNGKELEQRDTPQVSIDEKRGEEQTVSNGAPDVTQNAISHGDVLEADSNSVDKVVINADNVNVRKQPSMNSPAIAKAMRGMTAVRNQKAKAWTQITLNGSTGWIKNGFIDDFINIENDNQNEIVLTDQNVDLKEQKNGIQTNLSMYSVPNDSIAIQKVSQLMAEEVIFTSDSGDINRVVRYNQRGRDPFMPLIKDSLLQRGKVSIEQLLLVGVLIDGKEKVALFEGKGNKKYAVTLREADAVENGKVLKIFPDRVVFLLTEFGISRSFTLHLKNSNTDQEARVR